MPPPPFQRRVMARWGGRERERGREEEIERTFVNETVNLVRGDNEVWRWDGLGWFKLERLFVNLRKDFPIGLRCGYDDRLKI